METPTVDALEEIERDTQTSLTDNLRSLRNVIDELLARDETDTNGLVNGKLLSTSNEVIEYAGTIREHLARLDTIDSIKSLAAEKDEGEARWNERAEKSRD